MTLMQISRRELLAALFAVNGFHARAGPKPAKTVFMVLWRGETEVESGFREYFDQLDLPVEILPRSLDRRSERIPHVLDEIRETGPDLVYCWGTTATLGVAGRDPGLMEGVNDYPPQITDRPVVFTMVSRPVKSRIVKMFGASGRNVTGVSHIVPIESQIEAMRKYMPVDRIAIIFTPTEVNSVSAVEEISEIGVRLNIRVFRFPVSLDSEGYPDAEALPDLVAAAAATGSQVLYLGPDSFIGQYAPHVTKLANAHRLPSFASAERMLKGADALYGLVAPYRKVGRLTAIKAESILFGGEDPSDIPVEVLPEFSYVIRADVARGLGIFPALSILEYAELIEP